VRFSKELPKETVVTPVRLDRELAEAGGRVVRPAARGGPGSLSASDPRSAPRWPASSAAAAGLPRHGSAQILKPCKFAVKPVCCLQANPERRNCLATCTRQAGLDRALGKDSGGRQSEGWPRPIPSPWAHCVYSSGQIT
jgi:hypothetical protein